MYNKMESFALIKNALIEETDKMSVKHELDKPMKNTLKTFVKIYTSKTFTGTDIVNNKFTVDIPKKYDNLSQLYVRATLSTNGAVTLVEPYFATRIFSTIRLLTKKGTTLQTITPRYTQARLDDIYSTELYTYIEQGLEPDRAFSLGSVTVIIPLFFFFSESEKVFLPTRILEQLEMEFIINDSADSMGIDVALTSASFEVFALYHDENTSNRPQELITNTKPNLPKYLPGSYDSFYEDKVVCPSGSTSARLLLRCPHPLFAINCSLTSAFADKLQIKTLKLTVGSNEFLTLDYRMNYQNYGVQNAFLPDGTFTYFFSKLKHRDVDSGLIIFSNDFFPCYLDITFDQIFADFTLHTFCDYRTKFPVSDKGEIGLSEDMKMSSFDQVNSFQGPAYLLGSG